MISFPEPANRILFQKRFALAADFGQPDATLGYTYLDEDDQKLVQKWLPRIEDDEATAQKWMENNPFCCTPSKAGFCYCGTEPAAPMRRLPLELLHEICDMTIPPHYMLNASLSCGPNSPWCTSMVTKRSLVLVSSAWYEAGIDLMYKHIFLRRLPATEALLATLTANPSLGALIRNITVMCFVPRNCCVTTRRNLTQILKFCPALSSLNHLPPFLPPTPFFLPAFPSTITSLKFSFHENLHTVYNALQRFCPQLEELSLYPIDDEVFDSLELIFPRLRALYSTLTDNIVVQKFSLKWHMPMLSRLTFRTVMRVENVLSTYLILLAAHGHRLEYVAFSPFPSKSQHGESGPLLASCPNLKHVVLPLGTAKDFCRPDYCYPSVKWVDFWLATTRSRTTDLKKLPCYPNIERPFRFLDIGLCTLMDDVPQAFDPRVLGTWSLDFPGICVRQA
ncbi:hypothetical protein C8R47DRAFT_397590 [Mycena vitilis]|nr:hypothetical protein C8R47DRAFT_397590 [Mycena vitilis]